MASTPGFYSIFLMKLFLLYKKNVFFNYYWFANHFERKSHAANTKRKRVRVLHAGCRCLDDFFHELYSTFAFFSLLTGNLETEPHKAKKYQGSTLLYFGHNVDKRGTGGLKHSILETKGICPVILSTPAKQSKLNS